MPLWTLLAIIVIGLGAVVAAIYVLLIGRARTRRQAVAFPAVEEPLVIPGRWRELEPQEPPKLRGLPWRRSLPAPKGARTLPPEEQARIKIIAEFAQSLPLIEPGFNTDWLNEMMEAALGEGVSRQSYEQWLQGQLVVPYQPAWMNHPLYQELRTLLEGQPILQEMDGFLDAVNRCYSECLSLLQDIYRDAASAVPEDLLERDGFGLIGGVYSDALGWCRGKSLREPSAKDYTIKVTAGPGGDAEEIWLYGAQATTFVNPLIRALDEKDAEQLRDLHLKLRRVYRSGDKAKQVVGMITQLQVQRAKLLNALGQLGRLAGAG